jgi:hypothetical protein
MEKNQIEENIMKETSLGNTNKPQGENNSKPVGCGKGFKRYDLPKIDEKSILELFEAKTIKEAKQLIQSSCYQKVRQNYESTIDSTFYD